MEPSKSLAVAIPLDTVADSSLSGGGARSGFGKAQTVAIHLGGDAELSLVVDARSGRIRGVESRRITRMETRMSQDE